MSSSTPDTTVPRRRSLMPTWLDLSEWPLRRKMALAVLIPVVLAMSFGGTRIYSELKNAQSLAAGSAQVAMLEPAVRLVGASNQLASATNRSSGGVTTDEASRQLESSANDLRRAVETSAITSEQRRLVDQALSEATPLYNARGDEQEQRLRGVSSAVNELIDEVSAQTGDTHILSLSDVVQGLVALEAQQTVAAGGSSASSRQRTALAEAIGRERAAIDLIGTHAGGADDTTSKLREHAQERSQAAASDTSTLPAVEDSRVLYLDLARSTTDEVRGEFDREALSARYNALRDSALVLGSLLAALAATLLIARLILEPIQRVRRGVLEVAHRSLPGAVGEIRAGHDPASPTAIPVHTSEEVGQLARAVDTMHVQALNLAVEQARLRAQVSGMFETMSRRSKALVDQQLVLIENLERDEEDPQRLDSLFRLDHLAAQMRRNGDSLLVLAGASSRSGRPRPLTLSETVQAAISGVSGYQRVHIEPLPSTLVSGAAAADVVHILGELIDNALSYSPPDSKVVVGAARAVDGGTLLEVVDRGLGIAADDLETLNTRLSAAGDVTPDTARRMGLFVSATLAHRHGMVIRLRENTGAGITASVYLPTSLIADGSREGLERSTAPTPLATGPTVVDRWEQQPQGQIPEDLPRETAPASASDEAPAAGGGQTTQERPATGGATVAAPAELTAAGLPRRVPGTNLLKEGGSTGPETVGTPLADDTQSVSLGMGGPPPASEDGVEESPASVPPRPKADTAAAFAAFFSARREVEATRSTAGEAGDDTGQSATDGPQARASEQAGWAIPESTPNSAPVGGPSSPSWLRSSAPRQAQPDLAEGDARAASTSGQASADRPAREGGSSNASGGDPPQEPVSAREPAPEADAGPAPEQHEQQGPDETAGDRDSARQADSVPIPLEDTPIFGSIRSSWLDVQGEDLAWSSEDADQGWSAAERAAAPTEAEYTPAGLPRRSPGALLVPGGSELEGSGDTSRDPEHLRRRLTDLHAGVRRAREESSFPYTDASDEEMRS